MNSLEGKVALITGAASGMGKAQAVLFAQAGAAVCLADLNVEDGEKAAAEIRAEGGRSLYCNVNVTNLANWIGAVNAAEENFGPVSILCNIAGSNIRQHFDDQSEDQWHFIVQTALTGAFLGIKAVVPSMRRGGSGTIINIGSLSTHQAGGNPAYAASKTGMHGLTVSTAQAYARDNIRCNIVSPGHVDTPFLREDQPHSPNDQTTSIDNPANYEWRLSATPLGRLVQPLDVAQAFLFLASDASSMITGAHLKVDGGAGFGI